MKIILKHKQQQGFILVIALILLVVMGISGIAAIRLSGFDEIVNSNTRSRAQAQRAAEAAIGYCRSGLFGGGSTLDVLTPVDDGTTDWAEGTAWKKMSVWESNPSSNKLDMTNWGGNVSYTYVRQPECIIENISEFMRENSSVYEQKVAAYRITVRAFSPNFSADDAGFQKTGAQVWMQVVVGRILG